jgi:hypothetical protein
MRSLTARLWKRWCGSYKRARRGEIYGPWQSVYTRFSRWSESGVLARLFEALARERDDEGFLIDATIVRAHQDASGAAKEGAPGNWAFARRSVHEDPRRRRRAG